MCLPTKTTPTAVPASVTEGLFWSWVINDLEELITMGPWSREHADELARRAPVPLPSWLRTGFSDRHVALAITIMGALMKALASAGSRSGGRSRLFQAGLLAYGAHGITHLINSIAWRGYTPGVATAPTAVLPYSIWALLRLKRAGVLRIDALTILLASVGLPVSMYGIHAATGAILGGRGTATHDDQKHGPVTSQP